MITVPTIIWVCFSIGIVLLLCLDAFILNPKGSPMTMRRALGMTAFWLSLALLFNIGVYFWMGNQRALEFLSGYVVEQSLSIDNLFVFLLIFSYFKIPPLEQQRVLLWGIISAQIMRAVFILGGIALLHHFYWVMYVFGLFLVFTGVKLFFKKNEKIHPENNLVLRVVGKNLSVFLVVLIVIETTDLIFAIDSIPAVLAITKDPFIAYSSNIFAILGLRALYFLLANMAEQFYLLRYGIALMLTFIGVKMLLAHWIKLPILLTLGILVAILGTTILLSIITRPRRGY